MGKQREDIFRMWTQHHRGVMFKVVRAYASSLDDQDDLFQEILLQLWRSIVRYRGDCRETTWIYRVSLNTALVWVRAQAQRRKRHRRILEHYAEQQRHRPDSDRAENERLVECLYGAIRQLPPVDASLVLMHLDTVSYEEMGEVLGMTANNIGARLSRARKRLGEIMGGASHEL